MRNKKMKKLLLILIPIILISGIIAGGVYYYKTKKQVRPTIKNQQENQVKGEATNETNDAESADSQDNIVSGNQNSVQTGWITKNINNWFTGNGDEVKLSISIPSDYPFYLYEDYSYRIGNGSAGKVWATLRLQDCSDNNCEFVTYKNRYENGDTNVSNIKNKNGIDFYLYNTGGEIGPNYCYAYSEKVSIAFSGWDLDIPCNEPTFRTMLNSIIFY